MQLFSTDTTIFLRKIKNLLIDPVRLFSVVALCFLNIDNLLYIIRGAHAHIVR